MEKVLIVQRLSGNNDAGMEKAAKKSLIQASCLCRTLNLPVCWFTSKETIWSSAAVKMTLSHSWFSMLFPNLKSLRWFLGLELDPLDQAHISILLILRSWTFQNKVWIWRKKLGLRWLRHMYVKTHYSCPWPNTFKKSFKISWIPSCNSNQLEVTLFAINLPISYWYTGLYRVSMPHVPPPGQRGDKDLSSSSSNNKRLKVKI